MKKQIEEMAKDIACNIAWDEDEIPTVNCLETAKRLSLKNYRKASDVAREIFDKLDCMIYRLLNDRHYIVGDMCYEIAELKKKYTEGDNG